MKKCVSLARTFPLVAALLFYLLFASSDGITSPLTIFTQEKALLATVVGGTEEDHFGYSVSVSGDTAVVGAYQNDYNGTNSGSAYIFYRNHGGIENWGAEKKIVASDAEAYDHFGYSVSVNGDILIVGTVRKHNIP